MNEVSSKTPTYFCDSINHYGYHKRDVRYKWKKAQMSSKSLFINFVKF